MFCSLKRNIAAIVLSTFLLVPAAFCCEHPPLDGEPTILVHASGLVENLRTGQSSQASGHPIVYALNQSVPQDIIGVLPGVYNRFFIGTTSSSSSPYNTSIQIREVLIKGIGHRSDVVISPLSSTSYTIDIGPHNGPNECITFYNLKVKGGDNSAFHTKAEPFTGPYNKLRIISTEITGEGSTALWGIRALSLKDFVFDSNYCHDLRQHCGYFSDQEGRIEVTRNFVHTIWWTAFQLRQRYRSEFNGPVIYNQGTFYAEKNMAINFGIGPSGGGAAGITAYNPDRFVAKDNVFIQGFNVMGFSDPEKSVGGIHFGNTPDEPPFPKGECALLEHNQVYLNGVEKSAIRIEHLRDAKLRQNLVISHDTPQPGIQINRVDPGNGAEPADNVYLQRNEFQRLSYFTDKKVTYEGEELTESEIYNLDPGSGFDWSCDSRSASFPITERGVASRLGAALEMLQRLYKEARSDDLLTLQGVLKSIRKELRLAKSELRSEAKRFPDKKIRRQTKKLARTLGKLIRATLNPQRSKRVLKLTNRVLDRI